MVAHRTSGLAMRGLTLVVAPADVLTTMAVWVHDASRTVQLSPASAPGVGVARAGPADEGTAEDHEGTMSPTSSSSEGREHVPLRVAGHPPTVPAVADQGATLPLPGGEVRTRRRELPDAVRGRPDRPGHRRGVRVVRRPAGGGHGGGPDQGRRPRRATGLSRPRPRGAAEEPLPPRVPTLPGASAATSWTRPPSPGTRTSPCRSTPTPPRRSSRSSPTTSCSSSGPRTSRAQTRPAGRR